VTDVEGAAKVREMPAKTDLGSDRATPPVQLPVHDGGRGFEREWGCGEGGDRGAACRWRFMLPSRIEVEVEIDNRRGSAGACDMRASAANKHVQVCMSARNGACGVSEVDDHK
jgi:hypothetical protein